MAQPTVLDELDESLALGSCEDLGGNDAQSSQPTEGDMAELLIHKRQPPEGETILTLPDLQQPLQKKQKLEEPKLPSAFRVKWVLTNTGLVPFVMNMDTRTIHCGKAQMSVVPADDGKSVVLCLKGCTWDCPGHGHIEQCGCHCHILQWHYNTR